MQESNKTGTGSEQAQEIRGNVKACELPVPLLSGTLRQVQTVFTGSVILCLIAIDARSSDVDFQVTVQPILQARCVSCHGPEKQEGGLRLDLRSAAFKGGDSGPAFVPKKGDESEIVRRIHSADPNEMMPPKGERLSTEQITTMRRWIDSGAEWPESEADKAAAVDPRMDHWAWQPLHRPAVPISQKDDWSRNEIDRFVLVRMEEHRLTPSPEASRQTLIRRLSFDLMGLPPSIDETEAFVSSTDPRAYEKLVDQYLQSPRYGERWARHWLDVVHYGDTHGYDKDKLRHNAWPYRDYVIRALNEDKPYARFIQEQVAGDVLFPNTRDGNVALGFIAAGPWDFIGHAEVPESKIDGKIARHMDRDDMVANTLGTFCSVTIGCAQCHNHKFDPFTQEDYYSLQSVFAAVDRADRQFYADAEVSRKSSELESRQKSLRERQKQLEKQVRERAGEELTTLDQQIEKLSKSTKDQTKPEYGYHSEISNQQLSVKWVQVDLGQSVSIDRVVLHPSYDEFNNIGAGFGFPVRFKIESSDDPLFGEKSTFIASREESDVANPGLEPQEFPAKQIHGRYVRVTASKLAARQNDYIMALAELRVLDSAGKNLAEGAFVSAFDSIEAPPRWQKKNLVDNLFRSSDVSKQLAELNEQRAVLLKQATNEATAQELDSIQKSLAETTESQKHLPAPEVVFAGTIHSGSGSFTGTGASGGQPRPIHILSRGSVLHPGKLVSPGAIRSLDGLIPARFELGSSHSEGDRRAALANWLSDERNPLTWRSLVNRVWQYHFGRGIVETANDFGHMGTLPTHPELLDWLAVEFRDSGGSLKALHRQILTSATYRQSSSSIDPAAIVTDIDNRYLWRQNRRKLEAEAIRDAVFAASGKLDLTMGGPGYQDFVIEQEAHSPHYQYHLADPLNEKTWRRSIYRFIVRSQTQPFMTSLDCADPSMRVERRNESISAAQALALLNNGVMVTQANFFADRVRELAGSDVDQQVTTAYRIALGRSPTDEERTTIVEYARSHGLPNLCRVIFNLNEFMFID